MFDCIINLDFCVLYWDGKEGKRGGGGGGGGVRKTVLNTEREGKEGEMTNHYMCMVSFVGS